MWPCSSTGDARLTADAMITLAGACERRSAWHDAAGLAGDALERYRAVGDPFGAAAALAELGWYDMVHGPGTQAEGHLDEALELRRRHGDDRRLVEPLIDAAWLALIRGHGGEARTRFQDCFALARDVDDGFNAGEAARRALGDAAYGTLAAEGRAQPAEDLVRRASGAAGATELSGAVD